MTRVLLMIMIVAAACGGLAAGEVEILETARQYYEGGDYYNAITEVMRYQFLFPAGRGFAQSMLLMGKAYYRGENYKTALGTFYACGRDYAGSPAGEEALYLAGHIQLVKGEPYDSVIAAGEYRTRYPAGRFVEELDRDACFAAALTRDPSGSREGIRAYREKYPQGKYRADLERLENTLSGDAARPRRHLWLSVLGSAIIPGFGHFYTGHYTAGILTLFSNALFIFMICNGAMIKNTYQIVFFSLAEAAVYQYNLFSAVRVIDEYNGKRERDFFKSVRLGMTTSF
jgi:hypothetical protein